MTLKYKLTDIQRTKVGEDGFAAVTLTPIAPSTSTQPAGVPAPMLAYGTVQSPSPIRLTGLPATDVADWSLDDAFTLTLSKQVAP